MIRDRENFEALATAVSRFVSDRLMPFEKRVDETDRIPDALIDEMRALGLFGLTIPAEYGGLGLTAEEECRLVFEFGKASPAFHSMFGTNNGIGAEGIVIAGTAAQKEKYLARMASGEIIGAFAMTEPDAGSDVYAISSHASPVKGGWRLNGTKRFITNAPVAGVVTVLARTDQRGASSSGLSTFLVDADSPGVTLGPEIEKMGHHGSPVCDVMFDDCFVPSSQLLGELNEGYKLALKVVSRGRMRVGALCVGIAERLISDGIDYSRERKQFGRPIADFQLIQAKLADCETEAFAGRAMVLAAAQAADEGEQVKRQAACCKYFCTEMVGRVADRVLQIHGGSGYVKDSNVERLYRDVRLFRLYEGTSEIQQLIIAKDMLKAE